MGLTKPCSILQENYQEFLEQCFPSSHDVTYKIEWASFLYLGKLSYIFQSLDQFIIFYPLHFWCYDISLRVPLIWEFLLVSLPLGYLHPFYHNHFKSVSWPSLSFSGFISALKWWQCQHSQGQLFDPWLHLCSIWTSLPALSLFFFTALSSLLPTSLWIIHFCQKACRFITGRQRWRMQHTCTPCCLCTN